MSSTQKQMSSIQEQIVSLQKQQHDLAKAEICILREQRTKLYTKLNALDNKIKSIFYQAFPVIYEVRVECHDSRSEDRCYYFVDRDKAIQKYNEEVEFQRKYPPSYDVRIKDIQYSYFYDKVWGQVSL